MHAEPEHEIGHGRRLGTAGGVSNVDIDGIMPCIAKPSRSSPPRLTHDPHVDHHLAIARDGRADHGLVRKVLGQ